jgi:hypothetical protein
VSLCTGARDETRGGLRAVGEESVDELARETTATDVRVYAELDDRENGA